MRTYDDRRIKKNFLFCLLNSDKRSLDRVSQKEKISRIEFSSETFYFI